jgi:hypothetical protein
MDQMYEGSNITEQALILELHDPIQQNTHCRLV